MALVAKSNQYVALKANQRGQISIFFSASLVVFISIIAFVINVGLFVKAKINLQNATDAAAFAGAAVQSRQLTKIAYLNWEMRNIYKEWMYKYYVVGNLNVPMVEKMEGGNQCGSDQNCMDFRLATDTNVLTNEKAIDHYNFPSVCIHIANSQTNVCKRFAVPGLPEFGGYSIPGTEEASRSFVDTLIGGKINDCVERSKLNMLVTSTWAYNVLSNDMEDTLSGQGPAILTDRQGAWPQAIELAMRIRNLEKVMNRPTYPDPVCKGGGSCTDITTVENEPLLGNERIIKAFYSGWRNLGNHIDSEMKDSFTLTELPPTLAPNPEGIFSNSNYLIPTPYVKQYVDLKLMMVNYATFYAALIPRADSQTSGACNISKVAIPVPGYPLGYYKNPDVLTYYAVRGEADFEGMFNPFSEDKIKLTAYAAAKPMGGRIGPMLFKQKKGEDATRSRTDSNNKFRSVPYVTSLDVVGTPNPFLNDGTLDDGEFAGGAPLPINLDNRFWIKDANTPIGGLGTGQEVQFGIPNLVYDFVAGAGDFSPLSYTDQGSQLYTIKSADGTNGDKAVGLFNYEQYKAFRGDIGGQVTPQILKDQILRVRAATHYEAANYLIPTPDMLNKTLKVDSFGTFPGNPRTDTIYKDLLEVYTGYIYAPLHRKNLNQEDILYQDSNAVLTAIINFMKEQKTGMDNYIYSLNAAAIQTYRTGVGGTSAAQGAIEKYEMAAKKISDIDVTNGTAGYNKTAFPKSCSSLAGQFWHFYYGDPDLFDQIVDKSECPPTLVKLLRDYFDSSASNTSYDSKLYKFEYSYYKPNWAGRETAIYSAYMPGPYNGVGDNGLLTPPPGFPNSEETMRRNFYSTKLVTLDSVQKDGLYDEDIKNFVIYSEGDLTNSGGDAAVNEWVNALDPASSGDLSSIRY